MPDLLHRKPSSSPIRATSYLREFHALTWIAIRREERPEQDAAPGKATPGISISGDDIRPRKSYDERVEAYLNELDGYMSKAKEAKVRRTYAKCSTKTLNEAEKALANMVKGNLDDRHALELKEELLTAVKGIFYIFLALDQKSTICVKLWGAAQTVITVSRASLPDVLLRCSGDIYHKLPIVKDAGCGSRTCWAEILYVLDLTLTCRCRRRLTKNACPLWRIA
jgi:hypothetical protein